MSLLAKTRRVLKTKKMATKISNKVQESRPFPPLLQEISPKITNFFSASLSQNQFFFLEYFSFGYFQQQFRATLLFIRLCQFKFQQLEMLKHCHDLVLATFGHDQHDYDHLDHGTMMTISAMMTMTDETSRSGRRFPTPRMRAMSTNEREQARISRQEEQF